MTKRSSLASLALAATLPVALTACAHTDDGAPLDASSTAAIAAHNTATTSTVTNEQSSSPSAENIVASEVKTPKLVEDSPDVASATVYDGGTITEAGTYRISGEQGDVIVDAGDADVVLILDNATIAGQINVVSADKVQVHAVGSSTVTATAPDSAAIYSHADLVLSGDGTVTVHSEGEGADGIASSDDLALYSGTWKVTAADDAFRGKDSASMLGGHLDATAGDDGVLSDVAVHLSGGTVDVNAGADGVHSDVALLIDGGDVTVASSTEGLEAGLLSISDGTVDLTSSDDGINGSGATSVDAATEQEQQEQSEEAAGPQPPEGMPEPPQGIQEPPQAMQQPKEGMQPPQQGGTSGGQPRAGMEQSTGEQIVISGGTVKVNAAGDGIDSNGDLRINGGTVLVFGPSDSANGTFDYAGSFSIDGGTVIGLGSAGMPADPTGGTQSFISAHLDSSVTSGAVTIEDSSGTVIATIEAGDKPFTLVQYSSDKISAGQSYTVKAGASSVSVVAGSRAESSAPTRR
ncbi:carbohydrate-binding domain-containing protein [Corynebacterium argentoratense]|uniref:carbohydrate-binding domain-containing protein n=1 Tax=Corynebacterium argentoratense TaxID=42817 RepID=UPI001F1D3E5B|nr:carbohydrate-binding domain-containing protein [Corynebacterium argentoratense]MCF1765768.1 carbohydrate-binding domain-containing protein [Corynebacterium argentoratense]